MSLCNGTCYRSFGPNPAPWLISEYAMEQIITILRLIVCSVVCFGLASNVTNIFVFYKIGLTSTTNISFFSLAMGDLVFVIWLLFLYIAPYIDSSRLHVSLEVVVVTVWSQIAYAASAFASWVTAIISMERCCCIVFPMKVKSIFTKKTVTALLISMVVYEFGACTPYYFAFDLLPIKNPLNNKTRIVLNRVTYNRDLAILSKFIVFSVPTSVCFALVVLGTVFLIKNFKKSIKVRENLTGGGKSEKVASKDARVMKSVIFVCTIYIIGSFVTVFKFITSMIYPKLHVYDPRLGNFTMVLTTFGFLCQALSSSVNIFVYFKMNSSFKAVIMGILSGKK